MASFRQWNHDARNNSAVIVRSPLRFKDTRLSDVQENGNTSLRPSQRKFREIFSRSSAFRRFISSFWPSLLDTIRRSFGRVSDVWQIRFRKSLINRFADRRDIIHGRIDERDALWRIERNWQRAAIHHERYFCNEMFFYGKCRKRGRVWNMAVNSHATFAKPAKSLREPSIYSTCKTMRTKVVHFILLINVRDYY